MKKSILFFLILLVVNQIFAQNIKIKGSDTVLPLTQTISEVYMKKDREASIMVTGGGSGVGIAALENGTTDIAQCSRRLKIDEKLKLKEKGMTLKEVIIAFDALAVIVHPSNKVSQLTREQLENIYTGKITNWKDVGGADMHIVVYSRETSSGTYDFFKEHVLDRKNFTPSALLMPATGAIVQSVSQTKGAIGYVGLAYLEKRVKALKVSYDKGKTYVLPSVAAAKNKTYPINRPLYYYYLTSIQKTVGPFVNFVLSPAGQQLVLKTGYVPL
ncbi:MAG: PstS family phosphate ABC transporter substrate-binding protein [Bacteroidales bacterium]